MNQSNYRALVLGSVGLGLLAGALDTIVPSLLPEVLRSAQDSVLESASTTSFVMCLAIFVPGICLAIAGTYGLYFFRHWAPRLAISGTALILAGASFMGAAAHSGVSTALGDVSSYLWGASLLVPLLPQYKSWFERAKAPGDTA